MASRPSGFALPRLTYHHLWRTKTGLRGKELSFQTEIPSGPIMKNEPGR